MAANCWLVPGAMKRLPAVTAIETRATGFTFSVAEALMDPRTAVIMTEPPFRPLANPAGVIPATAG